MLVQDKIATALRRLIWGADDVASPVDRLAAGVPIDPELDGSLFRRSDAPDPDHSVYTRVLGVWHPLAAGGVGMVPPFTRLLYVDRGTAVPIPLQDGSVGKPYNQIGAALAAAALGGGGFSISVTPGVYAESLTIPDLDGISIIGQDAASTSIVGGAIGHTIDWKPAIGAGAAIHKFMLRGLTIKAVPGFDAIHIDGSNNPAPVTFLDTDAEFVDLQIEQPGAKACVSLRCAGRFYFRRCTMLALGVGTSLDVSNVTTMVAQNCTLNGKAILEHDPAVGPVPASGRNVYAYTEGTTDFYDVPVLPLGFRTTLKGSPIFVVDESCSILGEAFPIVGPLAIDGAALVGFALGPLHSPAIKLSGTFGRPQTPGSGNVNLVVPPDVPAVPTVIDLSSGTFNGFVKIARAALPAAVAPVCFGRGGTFALGTAGSISVATVGAIPVNLDIRFCAFEQVALLVAGLNATIDRSTHMLQAVPLPAPINPIAIVPPFPGAMNGYQVNISPQGAPAGALFIGGKANNTFNVFGIVAAGADLELRRV